MWYLHVKENEKMRGYMVTLEQRRRREIVLVRKKDKSLEKKKK